MSFFLLSFLCWFLVTFVFMSALPLNEPLAAHGPSRSIPFCFFEVHDACPPVAWACLCCLGVFLVPLAGPGLCVVSQGDDGRFPIIGGIVAYIMWCFCASTRSMLLHICLQIVVVFIFGASTRNMLMTTHILEPQQGACRCF